MSAEIWHHKPTKRSYWPVLEVAGVCNLEGIDGHKIEVARRDLKNAEVWGGIQ